MNKQELDIMNCILQLRSEKPIRLPINYNHIIQGWLYHSISETLADFLHDYGFVVGKRAFRLFCFSRLMGPYKIKGQEIVYDQNVRLIITSPLPFFLEELVNGIMLCSSIHWGDNWVTVEKIETYHSVVSGNEIIVRCLSPVTVYSTMLRPDGRKYTVYFEPKESGYGELITHNLCHKFQAVTGGKREVPAGLVHVKQMHSGKMVVVKYKDIIIKGFLGKLRLSGSGELLQTAVDCGLGSKNAQGFGCVEVVR